MGYVLYLGQIGAIELLVVGAVAPLDAAVVALAAQGIACQPGLQRLEELSLQAGDACGIVSPPNSWPQSV